MGGKGQDSRAEAPVVAAVGREGIWYLEWV